MFVINIWHYLVPDSILQDSLEVENDKSHLLFESFFTTILLQAFEWVSVSAKTAATYWLNEWKVSTSCLIEWLIDWLIDWLVVGELKMSGK